MATPPLGPTLPGPLLNLLLYQAPLDALLFDAELVCRYAAPAADTLLGRTAAELIGLPADAIFGPGHSDLLAALHLAASAASTYTYPAYRSTAPPAGATAQETVVACWSVRIEPVLLHDYRGREEFRGVLVTLADVADLATERDTLRQREAELTTESADLRLQLEARRQRAVAARERVRAQLTPVVGYLQVLSRRPELLAGEDPAAVLARLLPYLAEAVAAVDEAAD